LPGGLHWAGLAIKRRAALPGKVLLPSEESVIAAHEGQLESMRKRRLALVLDAWLVQFHMIAFRFVAGLYFE
jgi:hypothetical protein